MTNVEHINGDNLPIHVRDKVDWENIECCVVATVEKDGNVMIYNSSVNDWTNIAWMLFVLNSLMQGRYKDIMDVTNDPAK